MEQRTWAAPKTGLMWLAKIDADARKLSADRQKFLAALAEDALVPVGVSVRLVGQVFVEVVQDKPEAEPEDKDDVS